MLLKCEPKTNSVVFLSTICHFIKGSQINQMPTRKGCVTLFNLAKALNKTPSWSTLNMRSFADKINLLSVDHKKK